MRAGNAPKAATTQITATNRHTLGRSASLGARSSNQSTNHRCVPQEGSRARFRVSTSPKVSLALRNAEAAGPRGRGPRSDPVPVRFPRAEANRSEQALRWQEGLLGSGRKGGLPAGRD